MASSGFSWAGNAKYSLAAVRRLKRDLEILEASRNPLFTVRPSESDALEWHFVLHLNSLPDDTPYHGGFYHGRLVFPTKYPHAPPSVIMETPSGRLQTGCKLCLSMTDFHPEQWTPAWSVETLLMGLVSYFLSDSEGGFGAMLESEAKRRALAAASAETNLRNPIFVALFPELVSKLSSHPRSSCSASGQQAQPDEEPPPDREARQDGVGDRGSSNGSFQVECWICRDTTDEPLVQPCKCRGSMSGVHASCVERWVRAHRRAGPTSGRPRCSVCKTPYRGMETSPGFIVYFRHHVWEAGEQLIRSTLLVGLLMAFQEAWDPNPEASEIGSKWRILFRITATLYTALLAAYKFGVLMVSLPAHRPPPPGRFAQLFFVDNPNALAKDMAEALAMIVVLSFGFSRGDLPLPVYLPFGLATLIFVAKCIAENRSSTCLWHLARGFVMVLAFPLALLCKALGAIWRHPRRLILEAHPSKVYIHWVAATTIPVLSVCCTSQKPAMFLWVAHTAVLGLCIYEKAYRRRWVWLRGEHWWQVWYAAALSAYVTNSFCDFQDVMGLPQRSKALVFGTSAVWFLTFSTLVFLINWSMLTRRYHAWQRQHGTFVLNTGSQRAALVAVQANQPPV